MDSILIRDTDVAAGFLCFCWLLDTSLAKGPQTSLGNMEILILYLLFRASPIYFIK